LTDAEIDHCPFHHDDRAGGTFSATRKPRICATICCTAEFLWADEFWGDYAFDHWMNEIRKALPSADFPLADVPIDHPLFHVLYDVNNSRRYPRSVSISGTARRPSADPTAPCRTRRANQRPGRPDARLHVPQHRLRDAFEREGEDRRYFEAFAPAGYAVGVNVLLYSMTH